MEGMDGVECGSSAEVCEVCGFEWDAVPAAAIPGRVRAAVAGFVDVLAGPHGRLAARPDATTWSAMECAAHVRDVLLNLRDRIVLGLALDDPVPHSMFADVRIECGLYARDQPGRLAMELDVAGDLLARTLEALSPDQLARPIFYGWPRPATRTLRWVGAQALHEAEHHLDDVHALLRRGA